MAKRKKETSFPQARVRGVYGAERVAAAKVATREHNKAVTVPDHVCDDCGRRWAEDEIKSLVEVHHLGERLDPGSVVPSGECPRCGAFCYRIEKEQPPVHHVPMQPLTKAQRVKLAHDAAQGWALIEHYLALPGSDQAWEVAAQDAITQILCAVAVTAKAGGTERQLSADRAGELVNRAIGHFIAEWRGED